MAPNDQTSNIDNTNLKSASYLNKKNHDQFIVKHRGKLYNIKRFLRQHPGGVNFLETYRNRTISHKLLEHSKSANYLLKEYEVGGRSTENNSTIQQRQTTQQEVSTNNNLIENLIGRDSDDEDLENLVDWSKPLLHQVSSLGEKYNEWVASPVDRKITLFENPILEMLSISPWYVIPIVWLPILCYFLYCGIQIYSNHVKTVSYITIFSCIIFGMTLWTLIEYSIHRWIFHAKPSGKSKLLITFHFLIHGLHHKMPFDDRRLVFPPAPAIILLLAFYQVYSYMLPEHLCYLIGSGTIIGYITYDMIHFYLHYGAPEENTFLYHMKRYHNQHHFVYHNSGFGISNPFWDGFFGTSFTLPKLSKALRW